MVDRLSNDAIESSLETHAEWARNGDSIQRTYGFGDFMGSIEFVGRVAERAEEVQHHPDILIRFNKVTITLSTHDSGGISERDFKLAGDCDRIYVG